MNKIFTVAALLFAALSGSAAAQSNVLSPGSRVYQSIGVTEMRDLMQELGFTIAGQGVLEDSAWLQVQVPSGGVFFVVLRSCRTPNEFEGCFIVQPYTAFNARGLTLSQINDFHFQKSGVTTVMLSPGDAAVAGMKVFFNGGVTRDNFVYRLAVFFQDLENFFSAISSGTIAEVNYERGPAEDAALRREARSLGYDLPDREALILNDVGLNAPKFLNSALASALE